MLGRSAKLKAAEDALADGRIDEAFAILSAIELRGNRGAEQILHKLAEPLLARGQDRLMSRRFADALADFDRAARCGAAADKVAQWRQRAVAAAQEAVDHRKSRDEAVASAEARIAAGSLAGAEAALHVMPDGDARRGELEDAIARRAEQARAALSEADVALASDDVATAVLRLRTAKQLHQKMTGVAEMESRVVARVVRDAMESFRQGRLQRAEQQLALLIELGTTRTERMEAEEALRLARDAGRAVGDDRYAAAAVLLGRLSGMNLAAEWIESARRQLDQLDELRRALHEGPLSAFARRSAESIAGTYSPDRTVTHAPVPRAVAPPVVRHAADDARGHAPRRMMLRIDGVGSFLLLTGQRVSIGRAGPGSSADVQLLSDLSDRQAEVIRAGEDYFVAASGGVELAGRPVEHALLQDGDRIRLGHRVRLKFLRPSRKSAAAVLEMGDGVRMMSDCRRAILLGGPLLIGNRRDCHIIAPVASGEHVLVLRDGVLSIKPAGSLSQPAPMPLGTTLECGELRLSLQIVPEGSGVGRVVG